jgi:hypothetical protein
VYGSSFAVTRVGQSREDLRAAAQEFLDALASMRRGDVTVTMALAANRRTVEARFPNEPWRKLWHTLAVTCSGAARRA